MTPTDLHVWRARCGFPDWAAAATALGLNAQLVTAYAEGALPIPVSVRHAAEMIELRQVQGEMRNQLRALRMMAESEEVAPGLRLIDCPEVRASIEAAEQALGEIG